MVNWVDLVGHNVIASLAKETDVPLTDGVITLLELFGGCVERESRTHHIRTRKAQRALSELRETLREVNKEVEDLRPNLLNGRLNDRRSFFVLRDPETHLPVIHLCLRGLPELVICVARDYAAARHKRLTFGLRAWDFCAGPLVGRVAQAANFLAEKGRQSQWKMSVPEVVSTWVNAAKAIPPEERRRCARAHTFKPKHARKRRSIWRPRPKPAIVKEANPPPEDGVSTEQVLDAQKQIVTGENSSHIEQNGNNVEKSKLDDVPAADTDLNPPNPESGLDIPAHAEPPEAIEIE